MRTVGLRKTSVLESELSQQEKYRPLYLHYDLDSLKRLLQPALLKILLDFDRICREADIYYVLTAGVLLGAIREKGFIAWDDDVDVLVFPDGYKRIQQAIVDLGMEDQYEFIPPEQSDVVSLDAKFMSKTVTLGKIFGDKGIGHPLYIDVLTIENVPNNKVLWKIKSFFSNLLYLSYNSIRTTKKKDPLLHLMAKENAELRKNLWIRRIVAMPAMLIGQHRTYRILKWVCSYGNNTTRNVTVPFGVLKYSGEMQPRSTFENSVLVEFEGHMFPAPQNYKGYLENRYGDYMTPPPERERGVKCFQRRDDWQEILNDGGDAE